MQASLPKFPQWVYVVLAIFVSGGTLTFALVDGDGDGHPDRIDITAKVDPIDPGPTIAAPPKQVERAAEQAERAHGQLEHEHDGPGKPPDREQLEQNREVIERDDVEGLSPTLAGGATFNQRGCRTIPIGANFTPGRRATPTIAGPVHETVSPEIPGWGDVLGIGPNFFGRPGTGASSHYVIDGEGHCAYIVRETDTAWTAGNMNWASACQIEMIGTPDANGWHRSAGMAKATLVLRDCSKRWGIPIQVGNTAGCNVLRAGLVDHNELECGNDHWDICRTPEKARTSGFDPCPLVYQIVKAMRGSTSHLTKPERMIATRRCEARKRVIAASKGSKLRRDRLATSRKARKRVRRQMTKIDRARKRDGKPWRFRHRGIRRHELGAVWTGKGC